eukprot:COSAG03_NODE_541_length_7067_cov_2.200201_7_plen_309_part_00
MLPRTEVVNGGVTAGALAFSDALPQLSAAAIGNASKGIQSAFASYGPAGAWTEGLGYWGYGTNYALVYIDSMATATGSDGGASASPGLNETGLFCLHGVGPSWKIYNWGDSGSGGCDEAVVEQLGALYPALRPVYSAFVRELRVADPDPAGNADTADMLLALRGPAVGSTADIAALPTSAVFAERALGSFRSSWLDGNATWLAFKGCRGHYSHNDLDVRESVQTLTAHRAARVLPEQSPLRHDLTTACRHDQGGSFVLEMGGVRWAVDLGADSYGLKGCARTQQCCRTRAETLTLHRCRLRAGCASCV